MACYVEARVDDRMWRSATLRSHKGNWFADCINMKSWGVRRNVRTDKHRESDASIYINIDSFFHFNVSSVPMIESFFDY